MEEPHLNPQESPTLSPSYEFATNICVTEDDFFIKQEPADTLPEDMVYEYPAHFLDPQIEEGVPSDRMYEEIDASLMRRAVSPPSIPDDYEDKIQELSLLYKERYGLKTAVVRLENCDKIWKTLQLIKSLQDPSETDELVEPESDDSFMPVMPEMTTVQSMEKMQQQRRQILTYNRKKKDRNNKLIPDFRYTVKSKRKVYHCLTCNKNFTSSDVLRQHATEVHGIYVVPKRMYQMVNRNDPSFCSDIEQSTEMEIESDITNEMSLAEYPECTLSTVEAVKHSPTDIETSYTPNELFNSNINIAAEDNLVEEPTVFPSVSYTDKRYNRLTVKEKVKCVLCKRISTNIVNHMKDYHKVGCISSILAQCEKVDESADFANPESAPFEEPVSVDVNVSLSERVKKRKRNLHHWTMNKRKQRVGEVQSRFIPSQITTAEKFTPKLSMAPTFKSLFRNMTFNRATTSSVGPFKCVVCFGTYKSRKTYNYHKLLHKKRGETPENFDPAKCRFLNSPLRGTKVYGPTSQVESNYVKPNAIYRPLSLPVKYVRPNAVYKQTALNKFVKVKTDLGIQEKQAEVTNQNEPTENKQRLEILCECGRSFRYNRTLRMHKESCQLNAKDNDSAAGISIKIKKNKNDKYEVVQNAAGSTPVDEICKESRSSKDSDALSNDSGVVFTEESNKTKTHSILRIQTNEDDEEVDVEVGNEVNEKRSEKVNSPNSSEGSAIPSLANLCKEVLSKSDEGTSYVKPKDDNSTSSSKPHIGNKCPCGKQFKSLKWFTIHVKRFHPLLLKCNYCSTNFDRIEDYVKHRCKVPEGKLFVEPIIQTQCLQCGDLVDMGETFDKHMKAHSPETAAFHCFKCELQFENIHQRKLHFDKHHGFALCRVCSKLLHIDYICKHEAYHDGLGHPCHICKKAFSQKTFLKKHMQNSHDPLVKEVVNCIVCSKDIKMRYLKKHMSYHLHKEICKKCNKCCYDNIKLDNDVEDEQMDPEINCDPSISSDKTLEEHSQDESCKTNGTATAVMKNLL